MSRKTQSKSSNFKDLVLGTVVIVSLLGLLSFAVFDETARPVFLDVGKLSIGFYMGYLIPNQN